MNRLIIIGASGHGKVAADIARLCGYRNIDFLDDNECLQNCGEYKVIGKGVDFRKFMHNSTEFFVAIGDTAARQRIQERIEESGGNIATLIHQAAILSEDVQIGKGSVLMAGTVVNVGTVIKEGCIINTASSVDHDCRIGKFVHVAVGAHLSGTVKVGNNTWIGAGATISNNVNICDNCIIGAGAVVIRDIDIQGTYIGVPAKIVHKGYTKSQ